MTIKELLDYTYPHNVRLIVGDYDTENQNKFKKTLTIEPEEAYDVLEKIEYITRLKINDLYAKNDIIIIELVPRERPKYLKNLKSNT